MRKRLFAAVGAVVAMAFAGGASAQTEAENKAAAQALFEAARDQMKANNLAEACPKFRESLRLDPSPGTKFYLADCLEKSGKITSAWSLYVEVADAERLAGRADREKFSRTRADALRPKLPKVSIVVPAEAKKLPNLVVKRDETALGEPQWGVPIPVDPGTRTIVVMADGKTPWKKTVEAKADGETTTITVPASLDAAGVGAPPAAVPPRAERPEEPPKPPPEPEAAPSKGSALRTAGFVVGAVGIAGLGASAVFGGLAMSKQGASNDGHCGEGNVCDAQGLALRKEGIQMATLSTVTFIAGGVLTAGGVVMILVAPSGKPVQGKSLEPPRLAVGVGAGNVQLGGAW